MSDATTPPILQTSSSAYLPMGVDTGSEHERAVGLQRPGPYRIEIGRERLARTAIETATTVALRVAIHEGYPRLVCAPDGSGRSVTRTLSARTGEQTPSLTLPEQFVEATGLAGTHALPYSEPGSELLYVGFDRPSRLGPLSLSETARSFVSRRAGGDLAVSLDDSVAGPLASASTLRFSVDHYGGQPFFVLDATEHVAPDGAIELTANPNTGRESTRGLSFHFPRVIGRLFGVGSTTTRWGRTRSGNRLVGTLTEARG